MEKIGDKTYVVMMDYRGQMAPRVMNFRNMWKIGRKAEKKPEAVLNRFPDAKAYTDRRSAEIEEDETGTTEDDVEWDVLESGAEKDDAGSDGAKGTDAESDAGKNGAGDNGRETRQDTTAHNDDADTGAPLAEGAMGEEIRAEARTERLESRESREGARGALTGDHLRMDRIFTRRGREVRPPKRLDL